jgi:hypothetical protein
MKAVLVMNPYVFRRKGLTATTLAELADPVSSGDLLFDAVSKQEYKVAGRGFPPRHGDATVDRLVWSREISAAFRGACDEANGRLLVDKELLDASWHRLSCSLELAKGVLPLAIPIVGNTTIGDHQSPSIAVFDSGSNASLVTALPTSALGIGIGASITFSCQTPSREVTLAYLMIERVTGLPAHGRILGWTEKDVAPEFIY